MKRLRTSLTASSGLAILLTVASVLFAGQSAFGKSHGGEKCKKIRISLQTIVDFNSFTAVGTVSGGLEGTVRFIGDPTSTTPVMGQLLPPTRNTLSFTGQVTFSTEDGTLTTRNVGVFQPGPFSVGVELGTVIAGTGKYAQATGILAFAVSSDETGTRFSETGRGTICTKNNDYD